MRSITLIPVSRISASVAWSAKVGGSRWIGIWCGDLSAAPSSTGSPMTLMRRPSVSGPTGTVIGLPVSLTGIPRTRPSVASIAMQRTVFSPRCCATSSTRLPSRSPSAGFETRSALKIDGSEPLRNSTSTTLPRTWLMRPVAVSLIALRFSCRIHYSSIAARALSCKRLGAADYVHQFLGDRGLARAVHLQRQPFDHFRGVVGRAVHRGHARALLARLGLEQRMKNRILEVTAQHHRHQFCAARLDQVIGRRRHRPARLLGLGLAYRKQPFVGGTLRECGAEFAVHQAGFAHRARAIVGQHARGEILREPERRQARIVDTLMRDFAARAPQMVEHLASDGVESHLFTVALGASRLLLRRAQHVSIVAAA